MEKEYTLEEALEEIEHIKELGTSGIVPRWKAINKVVEEVGHSISKDKAEKVFSNMQNNICGNDEYLGNRQCIELELLEKIKKELLEDK